MDKTVTKKQIVELLLNHSESELSVGDIGKLLNAEDKLPLITYHLQGLVERKIVLKHERKIGSTYRLNDVYTTPSYRAITMFLTSLIFLGFSAYMLTVNFKLAIPFLTVSAAIGVATSILNITRQRKEKIKQLYELVSY